MKYIILSDGSPGGFKTPRQLSEINGEPIIKRTIRLLKENGIISANYKDGDIIEQGTIIKVVLSRGSLKMKSFK